MIVVVVVSVGLDALFPNAPSWAKFLVAFAAMGAAYVAVFYGLALDGGGDRPHE
jgi:hypothetical protein